MQEIKTETAPAPLGPYSQAVKTGDTIYVAMQLPIGVEIDASIEEQTKQVLDNVQNILVAAESSMNKVVRTTVYLNDLSNGKDVNAIYKEYFDNILPARSVVNVPAIPFDYKIAVDVIATT